MYVHNDISMLYTYIQPSNIHTYIHIYIRRAVLEMADEFRHLTLHVIAEAILSLSAEECDETFAKVRATLT
jgi:hypothetical protein